MKKNIIIIMMTLFLSSILASVSFAASFVKFMGVSQMVIEGTIVSIDNTKNLFVIKDHDDGTTYALNAYASNINSLAQGDHAKVTVPHPGNLVSQIAK